MAVVPEIVRKSICRHSFPLAFCTAHWNMGLFLSSTHWHLLVGFYVLSIIRHPSIDHVCRVELKASTTGGAPTWKSIWAALKNVLFDHIEFLLHPVASLFPTRMLDVIHCFHFPHWYENSTDDSILWSLVCAGKCWYINIYVSTFSQRRWPSNILLLYCLVSWLTENQWLSLSIAPRIMVNRTGLVDELILFSLAVSCISLSPSIIFLTAVDRYTGDYIDLGVRKRKEIRYVSRENNLLIVSRNQSDKS